MSPSLQAAQTQTIPWNIVTKNLHGHELLRKKIHQKISKLARHLEHFPPDTVHLLISLERHPRKEHYTAALTLRVPSNIIRSEKSGPDLIGAFDQAVKALLRELESLKAQLRRENFWKRKARRAQLHRLKLAGFAAAPQADGEGPQNLGDVVRTLLAEHYPRLLRYVRRQLWHDVTAGEVPPNAIDPRAVVDEVARRALSESTRKPANVSFVLWFYMLARNELARRRRALRSSTATAVPLDTPRLLPEDEILLEGYDAEQPLDIIERQLEPPVVETRDLLPDQRTTPPDQAVSQQELLAQMRRAASQWPREDREVFELYYVEGFEPDEVAMVLGVSKARAQERIRSVQDRLRQQVLEQALI
ncbi:MAG: sigma-70 family RNA polymerase sigma factor [Verrucomicrobiae bacterium]|nr:sigma-70 family RNA polymerase sigma factor [Verrucomicrobiae bacterium]